MKLATLIVSSSVVLAAVSFTASAETNGLDCSEAAVSKKMEMVSMTPCFRFDSGFWEVRKVTNYLGECISKASLKENSDLLLPALEAANAKYKCMMLNEALDSNQAPEPQISDEHKPVRQ